MRLLLAALFVVTAASVSAQANATLRSCRRGAAATFLGDATIHGMDVEGILHRLEGVVRIDGSLRIGGTTLRDLRGLECLTAITGGLGIAGNSELTTLEGVHHLQTVGAELTLMGNPKLRDVDGLIGLRGKLGTIVVIENASLTSLTGLRGIDGLMDLGARGPYPQSVIGIAANPRLQSLAGLDRIAHATDVNINNNGELISLAGLAALRKVDQLTVSWNANLQDLLLPRLTSVVTANVWENPKLRGDEIAALSRRVGVTVVQAAPIDPAKVREERAKAAARSAPPPAAHVPLAWDRALARKAYNAASTILRALGPLAIGIWLIGATILIWPLWLLACAAFAYRVATRWNGAWKLAGLPPLLTLPIPLLMLERASMGNMEPPAIFGLWVVVAALYVAAVLGVRATGRPRGGVS